MKLFDFPLQLLDPLGFARAAELVPGSQAPLLLRAALEREAGDLELAGAGRVRDALVGVLDVDALNGTCTGITFKQRAEAVRIIQ